VAYLRCRRPWWDHAARAGAEVGLVLAVLARVSGSVWARHSWGVWWTWDPRLTTTLVMCFVYAGYLALRGLELPQQRKNTLCAVVGIVAFLDVPLVFVSARLWRSIHPAVFASEDGGLEPEMRLTVLACVASFGLLWLAFTALRARQLAAAARIEHLLMLRHEQDA
jgi:heme exporter protein C